MNLTSSNYFKYHFQWMEDSLTKVEDKKSKKTFQSLIMKVHAKDSLPKSKFNLRIVSYLSFEDYFSKF